MQWVCTFCIFFHLQNMIVDFWCCLVDMSKPVHRHLMEQKWRKDGGLDLLVRAHCSTVCLVRCNVYSTDGTYPPNECHSRCSS